MVFGSINVHFEITTTGVLSYLVACCKIVSRIKWQVVRDLCKDIYELTLKEDDYLNGPVDLIDLFIPDKGIDQDPLGPVQTSNFSCTELNTNLGRPK